MSKHISMLIGVIAVIVLLVVFRKQIYAVLPLPEKTKADLVKHDILNEFEKSSTSALLPDEIDPISQAQKTIEQIISPATIGLVNEKSFVPTDLTTLKESLLSGYGLVPEDLVNALVGKTVQVETAKPYGVDTKQIGIDKVLPDAIYLQGGAVIKVGDKVSGEIVNRLFGYGLPADAEFEVTRIVDGVPTFKPSEKLVNVINENTGDIETVRASDIQPYQRLI